MRGPRSGGATAADDRLVIEGPTLGGAGRRDGTLLLGVSSMEGGATDLRGGPTEGGDGARRRIRADGVEGVDGLDGVEGVDG